MNLRRIVISFVAVTSVGCGGTSTPTDTNNSTPSVAEDEANGNEATPQTGPAQEVVKGEDPVKPKIPTNDDDMAVAMIKFGSALADASEKNTDNCDLMGTSFNEIIDANAALIAHSKIWAETGAAQEQIRLRADELVKIGERLNVGVRPCMEHDGVKKAISRLEPRVQTSCKDSNDPLCGL